MTGTLRSRRRDGAFRFSYHSPPVLTADAASQRGSKQTEEARCRRQQESSWRLTELVGPGSETIAASAWQPVDGAADSNGPAALEDFQALFPSVVVVWRTGSASQPTPV